MVKARNALFVYAVLAVVLSLLPPLFPLRVPELREPLLMLLALVAFTLGLLLALLPSTPRAVLLGFGWLQVLLTLALGFAVGDILVMFCCWIAVPVLALLAGQLRRGPHRALVAAHAISAAAWVGITCAVVTLTVIGLTTDDIDTAVVVYRLVSQFDITLLPWANFATTLTGLALGLTTRWGLIRYRWVAAKLVISFAILFSAFAYVEDSVGAVIEQAEALAASGGSTAALEADGGIVFAGFGLPLLSLVAAMLLSLYKPGGKTRWGRRQKDKRNVRISRTTQVAEDTVELTLRPTHGSLPRWEPGAHVDLVLPSGLVRQYSIAGERDGEYVVTVLREPHGRGGSVELHRLPAGTRIELRGPRNKFPLVDAPSYLFIAGGIGITPFLPMIAARDDWRLVYRGRSRASMAYAAELGGDDRVTLLPADETPRPDLAALLAGVAPGTAVYCCGPESLMKAVEEAMPQQATLYTERFVPTERSAVAEPFEAVLQRSGVVVEVPAGRSLLDAIHEVDPTLDAACEDGICGSCEVRVLGGVPDHRDDVLQNHERDRTDVMYPCVSRAKGRRIVLDV
ncbi:PDR/VanB family oxidoreductase [Kribbella shirazensis]|uniref:Ferredoxin-NADP reductase n=1 Tax=Kribbella shirazensis TaxID=1105143 RepID=A0A7X6A1B4_9ACTN|nr:PDR/VanB family oxidoreductase [Kribbella shirazensis]NIK56989.1 ferredoxin-NADP reductase [Kribbella shirazensis]